MGNQKIFDPSNAFIAIELENGAQTGWNIKDTCVPTPVPNRCEWPCPFIKAGKKRVKNGGKNCVACRNTGREHCDEPECEKRTGYTNVECVKCKGQSGSWDKYRKRSCSNCITGNTCKTPVV